MGLSNVMKGRRHALGMSQRKLADLAGVTVRQIARYEADQQQPALNVAVAIAAALEISVAELAGEYASQPDLGGAWTLAWERRADTDTIVRTDSVHVTQHGRTVRLSAENDDDSPSWRGELRLLGTRTLAGWYGPEESQTLVPAVGSGTLLIVLAPHSDSGIGRWVSAGDRGRVTTGRVGFGRGAHAGPDLLTVRPGPGPNPPATDSDPTHD